MHSVQFIYVKNLVSRTVNGTFQEISFAVRVRDIGFGKRVAIHWCGEDRAWRETAAEFRCAEVAVVTACHDPMARHRSYELLARAAGLAEG